MADPLDVDGPRPAVHLVAALPRGWTTEGERLVLLALACDSYDGRSSAPGLENLVQWTGMHETSVKRVVRRLERADERRPALIARDSTAGRTRTRYRLLLDQPGTEGVGSPNVPGSQRNQAQSVPGQLGLNQAPNQAPNPAPCVPGQPGTEPGTNGAPSLLPEIPSSLSPSQNVVRTLLKLNPDDEKLQSVDRMMSNHGARTTGWLYGCHGRGDLGRLLDEAHATTTDDTARRDEIERRRCPHGVINGVRLGLCVQCEEDAR